MCCLVIDYSKVLTFSIASSVRDCSLKLSNIINYNVNTHGASDRIVLCISVFSILKSALQKQCLTINISA